MVAHQGPLHPADVTVVRGIRVTTVARTLPDRAGVLPREELHRVVEQAIRLGRLQVAGWRVVRFTWRQVVADRAWFVTRIDALLGGRLA